MTLESLMNDVLERKHSISVYNGWRQRNCIPRADICLKMAVLLNVSVSYLITGEEHENDMLSSKRIKSMPLLEKIEALENNDFQTIEKMIGILTQNADFGKK